MIKWLSKQWWAPINSYGPCVGLTLWRWGQLKVELWYAPADYETPEHVHNNSDGEFTILWSQNRSIYRKTKPILSYNIYTDPVLSKLGYNRPDYDIVGYELGLNDSYIANTPQAWGKWLSVRAGTPHAFQKGDSCMIWLVVERWKPGTKVTSPAEDFVLT